MKTGSLPKEMRGKYVSRAAFVKLQAEKKRLENEIKLMVSGTAEGGVVWTKWKKHYKIEASFYSALRKYVLKEEKPLIHEKPRNNS